MNKSESEIWQSLPGVPGVEVSTLGKVRTLDRVTSSEDKTRFLKGCILKQHDNGYGYLIVNISVDGKWTMKRVHRLVAQTFIDNPDYLPEVNHKNCDRYDNRVSNLEWCSSSYNNKYREKFGKALGSPIYAVNLKTSEVYHFNSQRKAGRKLGVSNGNINNVIKGRLKQAGGYWFKEDADNGIEIDKDKLNDIVDGMRFREGVFAVNLNTSEVSRFKSQSEASLELGFGQGDISNVIKGRLNQTHGYWFTNADEKTADYIERKLHDIVKAKLKVK